MRPLEKVKIGARGSKLSRRQVEEVLEELGPLCGKVGEPLWFETMGDRDLKSSLAPLEKTDFFTREIDQAVLEKRCDVGVHSAKDLPDPLPKGLKVVALTQGVDSSDSLVFRDGDTLEGLLYGSVIGSSSERRDRVVKGLRPDLLCKEVRGPVDYRLEALDRGEVDGLVVAEAALIRLGLTRRNRISLPGKSAPLQGQLAVVARAGDEEMAALFRPLDIRKKKRVLYLGTEAKEGMVHMPLIEIVPRDRKDFKLQSVFAHMKSYTHVIFSSQNGVKVFEKLAGGLQVLEGKKVYAVGKATAACLEKRGVKTRIAGEETQEGLVHLLALEDLEGAYILLPQSAGARPILAAALRLWGVRHQQVSLYDTRPKTPKEGCELKNFDEVLFSSPSTVEAFRRFFPKLPKGLKLRAIGPITERAIKLKFSRR